MTTDRYRGRTGSGLERVESSLTAAVHAVAALHGMDPLAAITVQQGPTTWRVYDSQASVDLDAIRGEHWFALVMLEPPPRAGGELTAQQRQVLQGFREVHTGTSWLVGVDVHQPARNGALKLQPIGVHRRQALQRLIRSRRARRHGGTP